MKDFLSSRIDFFTDKIKIVFATYTIVNENLEFVKQNDFKSDDVLICDYIFWKFPILTSSTLIKRDFLIDKKLFDPIIKRGQETDFYLNILPNISKDEYTFVDKPSFLYRLHENSITDKTRTYNPDYMISHIQIWSKALNIGMNVKKNELIKHAYINLILLLFQIIKNKDNKNLIVFDKYLNSISQLSLLQKLEIKLTSKLLILIRLIPKKLEYRWVSFLTK